ALSPASPPDRARPRHCAGPPSATAGRDTPGQRAPGCRHLRRSGAEQGGARGRKCAPPPPTRYPAPWRQTTPPHPGRSRPPGAPGRPRPRVAVGAADRSARHAAALASPVVLWILAAEIPGGGPGAPAAPRPQDGRPDPRDGDGESAVGRGAHPGRAPHARHPRRQVGDPALPARGPPAAPRRPGLGDLPAQPRPGPPGLRLPTGHRSPLPAALRLLHRRARDPPGGAYRRAAPSDRCLGRPAAARGHAVRPASALSGPRQRQQVRLGVRPCRRDSGNYGVADGLPRPPAERHARALPRQRAAGVPGSSPGPGRGQLRRVLRDYMLCVNHHRPHQGRAQQIPAAPEEGSPLGARDGSVQAIPIL
ncbi:MAG: hypothetical protein AVDCRST_MAG18-11, partial [uncultured Thermomicrobiales bacterium]